MKDYGVMFKKLLKALNDKDCPDFILFDSVMIISTRNITKIIHDQFLNSRKTIDDPFVTIYSDVNETRIKEIKISQILEAIEKAKAEA